MTEGALIGARFALMLDLAMLMGLPLFWWAMGMAGQRWVLAALAAMGMALSVLWLMASVAAMTGTPITSPDWASARILLTMTPIGSVAAVRGAALLVALGATALPRGARWALAPGAIAAATLAWTGHAGATEDGAGSLHRAADIAHIWVAAGWIGALAVLLHAVSRLRAKDDMPRVAAMLARFSLMGTLIVATLVVTGAINAIMIVGLAQLPALAGSRYGWLLGAKLALFGLMLGLAAANRWWLTPALEAGGTPQRAIAHLRLSLLVETSAALAIIGLVAWLGTLDPMA
ncbi:copper homeostasis membrane protein CopD [Sphingobium sp. BYY-5]|uniref:copper homeostasis membrane protein CopD n=1 Tax=Sphingobium sp. BYY-5 TaxID=2926400 RepID=UPI001FA7BE39|nr:copper homeostasis membrane protein CopD [Sphingobium sp. BYY-5]MCI4592397.1 copper homeostasis membrane protein CopD [Sphingobium sp. BYY-5]